MPFLPPNQQRQSTEGTNNAAQTQQQLPLYSHYTGQPALAGSSS